jgi:hypothetical protein
MFLDRIARGRIADGNALDTETVLTFRLRFQLVKG